jgi:glutathione synthase/RimK-type ligase-like ATP-grasp enzyme
MAARPTLLFSPQHLNLDASIRGARIVSTPLGKLGEAELLSKEGLPVPRARKIEQNMVLDEKEWGPFVVVKPNNMAGGLGISLERTGEVRWVDPHLLPDGDPRRDTMLAQQYVNTGAYLQCYRVFTVLGRVIYAIVSTATEALRIPDPAGKGPLNLQIAANGVKRIISQSDDHEVISLAARVHAKFPKLPNLGIDIVREQETGRLFILEINSRGTTWHLSSGHGLMHQRTYGLNFYGQFNALQTITEALIDATRKFAV